MNESKKIQEADYFLSQIRLVFTDHQTFQNNLSAFLSASRSALQYTYKESISKPGGGPVVWRLHAVRPVLKFLKEKRDCNIHRAPITPSAKITITDTFDASNIRDFLTIRLTDKEGNIIRETECNCPDLERPPTELESSVEFSYLFDDWSGTEDCITLSTRYLDRIRVIVADGVTHGFLAGTWTPNRTKRLTMRFSERLRVTGSCCSCSCPFSP